MKSTLLLLSISTIGSWAFSTTNSHDRTQQSHPLGTCLKGSPDETEWTSDFDDFIPGSNPNSDGDDSSSGSAPAIASIFQRRGNRDWSGIQSRQFSLGEDLVLADFVGKMGFDEVTDWEYYYENEEDPSDRKVVQPNPFDDSKPKRTRKSSGSVVRVFRGEFVGRLGGTLRSMGLDNRVLVKEFTGEMALQLARYEMLSVGKLQSELLADNEDAADGLWIQMASSRTATARNDDSNVCELVKRLSKSKSAPFLGILGEVNLAELEDDWDPNEFYRALSVPPPKEGAIWIVYEYAGLNTCATYSEPAQLRRSRIPPKKTFFGVKEAPPLPEWRKRADYVVKGIMKGAIEAVAELHDSGIAHRSIGRSSVILTSRTQDKAEPSSVYATDTTFLSIKLSDFGFSGLLEESTYDDEFLMRARSFGFSFRKGDNSLAATNFAMAEDLHALGFVFLGLILSSLAELPRLDSPMPATDEDTLQRLLGEIFDKDIEQFREYVEAEEVWKSLVDYLDENDGAGWTVLETLFKAREKAAENKNSLSVITARGLLSNPFFQ
ncbi:unnamed protein product [Cylindrotheca closterium]|uniref:Protein kinase domain-containing protein n=1 Tax=Cylindrotheca closterium TaxID=2856 RepID=A0AAD2FH22_9STRA|nr:unnamed protein product [Cylindrotheca closterium]